MITTAAAGYITRNTSSWFDPRLDWTKLFIFRYNSSPGGSANVWLYSNDNTYAQPYINLANSGGLENILVESFNGTTTLATAATVLVTGTNYKIAIRYTAASHLLELIINSIVVGSSATNLDSVSPQTNDFTLNDGFSTSAISVGYERLYQRALTLAQITAEQASITSISTVNLLSSCPLQTSIDLTDHVGLYLAPFVATGTITTDTNDPLLSVITGPPTNTTPATALDITLDSALFVDTLSGGSAVLRTWYKYTAQPGDRWLGSIGFGDLVTFKPRLFVYEGLANANSLTAYKNLSPANNGSLQFAVTAGNDYYFSADRNGAVTPATAIISIIKGPNFTVPVGAVLINDDISDDYVAVLVSTVDDSIVYNFVTIVGGEQGDVLPTSGYFLYADQIVGGINNIYNHLFQEVVSITSISGSTQRIRTCNTPERWYFSRNINPPTVLTIDKDGTLGTLVTLTGSTSIAAHAASNDETILYFAETGANKPVKTWDLVNNIAGANLAVGVANYVITDILYLGNDKIAVMYYKSSVTRDALLNIYSTAGATLISVSLGTPNGSTGPRMCYAINDPVSIWVYAHYTGANSVLQNVTVSTGAVASTRIIPTFESAAGVTPTTNTPPRFGASFSCPISVVRVASLTPPSDASGLYILTGTGNVAAGDNPVLTHDNLWVDASVGTTENVAIPNPFGEGFLVGDE